MERSGGGVLIREGDEIDYVYILRDGAVDVSTNGTEIGRLNERGFYRIDEPGAFHLSVTIYVFTEGPVSLFAMRRDNIRSLPR
jgi:CRP-like cAMP-binding protein